MKRSLALFSTSLVVGFSGALMPGPLLTAAIAGVARDGFWVGPALSVGHAIVEAAMVLALAFGLARLFKNRWVSGTIGLVGGLFLLWMGYDIAQSAWTGTVSLQMGTPGTASGLGWSSVLTGAVVSVTNPYWILWWATVGANYVLLGMKEGALGLGSVFTGHTLADNIWLVFVSFVVSSGRALMSDLVYRGILLVCSLFLIVLGLYFARSGLRFMRSRGVVAPA
jgi:threonine/homoserine/homoserine lactone efflux protein